MNLESRIKKLEKLRILDDGPIYVVWLPKECDTIEEWLEIAANPDSPNEWHAVSSRGVERIYYGSSLPSG